MTVRPGMYCLEYFQSGKPEENPRKDELFSAMLSSQVCCFPYVRFDREDLMNRRAEYTCGMAVVEQEAEEGLRTAGLLRYVPPCRALFTSVCMEYSSTEKVEKKLSSVMDDMQKEGLTLEGDPIFRTVLLQAKGEERIYYCDAWLPV